MAAWSAIVSAKRPRLRSALNSDQSIVYDFEELRTQAGGASARTKQMHLRYPPRLPDG
jgi:hypothetical protein